MNPNFTKENCDQWVNYAYDKWLRWVRTIKPDQYYLRESAKILVERMRNAIESGLNTEAWNLHGQLKKLGNSIYDMRNDFGGNGFLYEQAEINLECAFASYMMGDRHEAGALLDMTNGSFIHYSIHKAVACWISGCIHWQSQTHFDTALVNWEKSLQIVNELARNTAFEETFANGCTEIAGVMNEAIRNASRDGYPPAPFEGARSQSHPGPQQGKTPSPNPNASSQSGNPGRNPGPLPRSRNLDGKPGYPSARVRTFPIIGHIPAGSPVGIVDHSDNEAIIDGLEIDSYFYTIYSLVGENEININQNSRYFILKVNGDSMNNARPIKIENGDYVLVVKQDTAEVGDIVAAEIEKDDRQATLKRYSYKNGEYMLAPESINSANNHLTYKKDFYIRGKVIAVLKRND